MTLHLVIDCETTGLFEYSLPADAKGQPRLCQLGLIWLRDDLSVIAEGEYTIKPNGWTIPEEATAINGLTQEMLEEMGQPIDAALNHYAVAIDKGNVIVGFNAAYDIKLMRGELRRAEMNDRYMQTRTLDVMQGCRKLVDARTRTGKSKAPSLAEACNHFQIEREPVPHRALGGARATLQILQKLREQGLMPPYKNPYDKTKYGTGSHP
jgi:DNA polymerase-3 subunit epsilon